MLITHQPTSLREQYDAFAAEYKLTGSMDALGTSENNIGNADCVPGNDIAGPMWWMRDYLEFVLVLRGCATRRVNKGLPPNGCSRAVPCVVCQQHAGLYVPVIYWHMMPDAALMLHLAEYMRIRDELPPWKSRLSAEFWEQEPQFGVGVDRNFPMVSLRAAVPEPVDSQEPKPRRGVGHPAQVTPQVPGITSDEDMPALLDLTDSEPGDEDIVPHLPDLSDSDDDHARHAGEVALRASH